MGKAKKSAQENLSDLASLSSASSDKIATCLRSRYDAFNIYTNIGSRHLVVVNPLKELSLNDDQTSLEYVAAYKDPSGKDRIALDTHIFDLVNRVYSHMRRTGSDQNIVLR
jgi:chitin synthase